MQLGVKINVPYRLQKLLKNPTPKVNEIMEKADKEVLEMLREDISRAAPHKSGSLGRSIKINLKDRKVYSDSVYARAVELGHYAKPINTPKKMFLKFAGTGGDVFIRFVRTSKQPFFFPTLDKDRLKVRDIYDKAFDKLL